MVWLKSPLGVMLEMDSETLPGLVRVTVCTLLLVPGIWAEKVSEEGDKPAAGAVQFPIKVTV